MTQRGRMDVYWLEQAEDDIPAGNDWLSEGETVRLNGMRFAKRRGDWRLGRWTAKCAVAACLGLSSQSDSLPRIEIRPEPCGAPEVYLGNRRAPVNISISHSHGVAVCAIARGDTFLGCDLEVVERRGDAFLADYFTLAEQRWMESLPHDLRCRAATLFWSAKESALKALRQGLRVDTRDVAVTLADGVEGAGDGWNRLQVKYVNGRKLGGWWREEHRMVHTIVAAARLLPPVLLKTAAAGMWLRRELEYRQA